MFAHRSVTAAQHRMTVLRHRSTRCRQRLLESAQPARAIAGWVDLGIEAAGTARAVWAVLRPWLPLFRGQKPKTTIFISKLAGALSFARIALKWWQDWQKSR